MKLEIPRSGKFEKLKKEKTLAGGCSFHMMMTTVAILFVQLLVFRHSHCKEICQSEVCKEEAFNLLQSMNKTIDPCDDFYEFACGGWIKKNPIPQNKSSWDQKAIIKEKIMDNIFNILNFPDNKNKRRPFKLARTFYRSCRDLEALEVDGLDSVHNALKKLGLPVTPPTDDEAKNYDLGKIAGLARRYYGINIFMRLTIWQHPRNSTLNRLTMNKSELLLPILEEALREPEHYKTMAKAIRQYIKKMIKLAEVENKVDYYTTEFLDFLTAISKIMGMQVAVHFKGTISTLQNACDPFARRWNWTSYMDGIFNNTGVTFRRNVHRVDFHHGTFLQEWHKLLNKTPMATLVRVVYFYVFITIAAEATFMGTKFSNEYKNQFYYNVGNQPRWIKCVELVNKHYDKAITAAYVEKHFSVKQKKKVIEIWNDVRSSFDEMLNELPWMDSMTKSEAHKKLDAMKSLIAYPDWITNPKKMDAYYEEYDADEVKLFENIALATEIEIRRELNKFMQTPIRNKWTISTMNAYVTYTLTTNSVTIPIGILHLPFFGDGIDALNYGGIGATLGRELTHGFDSKGWLLDGTGKIRRWWSRDTWENFHEKIQCMIKQYNDFVITQIGSKWKVNGTATYLENMADNGGLREAFRAYKMLKERNKIQKALPGLKYTDEQLFFLGYAQSWCRSDIDQYLRKSQTFSPPFRYRVIGTLQNNDDFAKVFNCRLGSPMNPPTKCIIW